MNTKIAVFLCYFGQYPWYFPWFLHSCRYNPSIDFIMITDNTTHLPALPPNYRIIHMTIPEFAARASAKLGFPVSITDPYKLCDYKPTFGFLFPELLVPYDFWAHSDIDLVFGNIRAFMTDDLLQSYDVISARHDYITGTFSLFRNAPAFNTLFMESRDYRKVFSDDTHYCFDECAFLYKHLEKGHSVFDFPDHIQSMTYVAQKASQEGRARVMFDFIIVEGTPGKIKWEKGTVLYKDEFEALYYHLIRFKTVCRKPKLPDPMPDTFYFTPRTIQTKIR